MTIATTLHAALLLLGAAAAPTDGSILRDAPEAVAARSTAPRPTGAADRRADTGQEGGGETPAEDELRPWRTYEAAVIAANEAGRFGVVVWAQQEQSGDALPMAELLRDPEVARWVDERAVLSLVDLRTNMGAANRNGVRVIELPCLDILRSDGLRVARLRRGSSPSDFLATIVGFGTEEPLERPTGEDAKEPFRWLAWGNQRFLSLDDQAGPDATEAYRWLLTSAEAYRPGFRARFLEFLISRLNQNRKRHDGARVTLVRELEDLRKMILEGEATRQETYEYTRFAFWLGQEPAIADLFVDLGSDAGPERAPGRERARLWLLDAAAPHLARRREHVALDEVLGEDPAAYFRRRIGGLPGDSGAADGVADGDAAGVAAGAADPDFGPLDHAIPDSEAAVHEDAGWIYFALLDADRRGDAAGVVREVAGLLPGVTVWAECANRAIALGEFEEAERLIAEARETVQGDTRRLDRVELRLQSVRQRARSRGGRETPEETPDGGGGDAEGGAPGA